LPEFLQNDWIDIVVLMFFNESMDKCLNKHKHIIKTYNIKV